MWDVEYTNEFKAWFDSLEEAEQNSIGKSVRVLLEFGPSLGRPHADTIYGSNIRR